MSSLDHKQLCELAVAWLKRPNSRGGPGCSVALSETANYINREIPDAIGWKLSDGLTSVLVEVKVSRADFLADAAKPHRQDPSSGMGAYRYFMAPEGLIKVAELPPKWGLVEVNARGHLKVRAGHVLDRRNAQSWKHSFNQTAEAATMVLTLGRVGDPQKLQDMLREASNRASSMERQYLREREAIKKLEAKICSLTNQLYDLLPDTSDSGEQSEKV